MNYKYTNLQKAQVEKCVLCFISKNKRGFSSKFEMSDIFKCIVYKLKTGCQWSFLFVDIKGCKFSFSRQTHSLVKKSAQSAAYQHRKRGRTSNILIMTDERGIPIANGGILSGNHNDLSQIIPQYGSMIDHLRRCGVVVTNSIQNADKGFDFKELRRVVRRRKMVSNNVKNKRNRKGKKRGAKPFFNQKIYDKRFVNERTFEWIDSFRTLLVRFDTLDATWLSWHYLVFALILLKV